MTRWRKFEWMVVAGVLVVSAPAVPRRAAAQSPPPITGTIALEGSMKKFYRGVNVIIVTTIDGVQHAYRFTKDLVVHGGKGTDAAALEGVSDGSKVVVHYTIQGPEQAASEIDVIGAEGLAITEGTVASVDRDHGEMTIRYSDGGIEVFRLTDRAMSEAESAVAAGTLVSIYYSDEHGQKVAHFFKKVGE